MSREVAEKTFAPGNLVFGGSLMDLQSYIEQGIRPASAVGKWSLGTPDNLCFALLSDKPLPTRYNDAFHYAPGGSSGGHTLGIVVSREGLLATFPKQVYAIGEYFGGYGYGNKRREYQYNPKKKTVFGVPIRQPSFGGFKFCDEVRVYPRDVQTTAVNPDLWTGIVIENFYLHRLPFFVKAFVVEQEIPIFSPRCALLVPSLARQVLATR